MYCRNCGNKIVEGDKFCSECGTRVAAADSTAAPVMPAAPEVDLPKAEPAAEAVAEETPLFEPFDFKAFGFDFSELGLGTGLKEETKPTPPTETFDWNTGEFPDRNTATKTEEVDFNWSLSPDEPEVPAAPAAEAPAVEAPAVEIPAAPEVKAPEAEPVKEAAPSNDLFGDLEETRKQSEEIDKFFTFHRKNEEFQKILDREYEKVRSGNIIAEELSAAEAGAEDLFTARQPEDPMEELFASEGVVKGYEPKPIETDVLERIEAADEEKRVREEAARLVEEERARREAEEAAAAAEAEAAAAQAEETVEETAEPEEAPAEVSEEEETPAEEPAEEADDFDLFAQLEAMEEPAEEAAAETEEPAEEQAAVEEAPAEEAVEEPAAVEEALAEEAVEIPAAAEEVHVEEPAEEAVDVAEAAEEPAEEKAPAFEFVPEVKEEAAEEPVFEFPAEPAEEEDVPEKTKTVDKAAILAGMAIANEMVERDRAIAAEQAAAEAAAAAPVIEETNVELPDFLGHEETVTAEQEAVTEEEPEVADEEVELEIFEQLEKAEEPAEEIVLTDSQTLMDLFADAETVENHEKGWTEHTLILSEDSVAEILNASGEEEVTENTVLFSAETLGAILAEAEQDNPEGSEVVVSVESLTEVPEVAQVAGAAAAEVVEEAVEEHHGKGRTVLKVLLVILIILLALEVAGVAIKLLAPTSNAANFIDNQLTKVFQLISGEDDKELSVLDRKSVV